MKSTTTRRLISTGPEGFVIAREEDEKTGLVTYTYGVDLALKLTVSAESDANETYQQMTLEGGLGQFARDLIARCQEVLA